MQVASDSSPGRVAGSIGLNPWGGNVGIGTTTPSSTLEIKNTSNSWDDGLRLTSGDGNVICKLHPENAGNYGLMLDTNFYVAGNIGIGVEPDATHDLKVAGSSYLGATTITSTTNMLLTLNPTAGNYGGILFQYGGVTKGASIYNSNTMVYGGETGIATRIQAGGGYGLHIDYTNQNVHIGGTSNASVKLYVTGEIGASDDINTTGKLFVNKTAAELRLKSTSDTGESYINFADPSDNNVGQIFYGHSDNRMIFRVNDDERMRIENTGYTKITDDGDTTWQGYNFHAITQSAASQPTVMIYNDNAGGDNYGINVIHRSTSANTTGRFFLGATNNGGTENIKIYTNGNIQNTNNSYTQLSDLSLKENVVDATDKLEEVKKLRVINWNFIGDDLKQIGVAAQEVEKIFPGLVDEVEHNQDGETSMVKSVKYSVFVPILIKAIQELEARVKELENK